MGLANFFLGAANVAKKVIGHIGQGIKRIGHFVHNNHAGIATVGQAIAHASGNEHLKALANGMSVASNAYGALQNYHAGAYRQQFDPNIALGTPAK